MKLAWNSTSRQNAFNADITEYGSVVYQQTQKVGSHKMKALQQIMYWTYSDIPLWCTNNVVVFAIFTASTFRFPRLFLKMQRELAITVICNEYNFIYFHTKTTVLNDIKLELARALSFREIVIKQRTCTISCKGQSVNWLAHRRVAGSAGFGQNGVFFCQVEQGYPHFSLRLSHLSFALILIISNFTILTFNSKVQSN